CSDKFRRSRKNRQAHEHRIPKRKALGAHQHAVSNPQKPKAGENRHGVGKGSAQSRKIFIFCLRVFQQITSTKYKSSISKNCRPHKRTSTLKFRENCQNSVDFYFQKRYSVSRTYFGRWSLETGFKPHSNRARRRQARGV